MGWILFPSSVFLALASSVLLVILLQLYPRDHPPLLARTHFPLSATLTHHQDLLCFSLHITSHENRTVISIWSCWRLVHLLGLSGLSLVDGPMCELLATHEIWPHIRSCETSWVHSSVCISHTSQHHIPSQVDSEAQVHWDRGAGL